MSDREKEAADILAELERLGVTVEANGEGVHYSPANAVSPYLHGRMVELKQEIVSVLAPESQKAKAERVNPFEKANFAKPVGGDERTRAAAHILRDVEFLDKLRS